MRYRITYGDWSDDGHGMYENVYIEIKSAHTLEDLQGAYANNCARWGATLGTICEDYEDSTVPNSVVMAMKADGVKVDDFLGQFDDDFYCEDPVRLAVAFMSTGLEGFEWETVSDEAVCLTGGYSAKIERSFGYGLLSH